MWRIEDLRIVMQTLMNRLTKPLWASIVLGCMLSMAMACSLDNVTGAAELPAKTPDPAIVETPPGALSFYRGMPIIFREALDCAIFNSGLITDELVTSGIGGPIGYTSGSYATYLDSRTMAEGASTSTYCYPDIQGIRSDAEQGVGLLRDYPSPGSPALIGHLRALEGYAEIMLADLYCSGIPLSTVDYKADYTLKPGSSTSEVYNHAITLFDSTLLLSTDSARFMNLARIGKGRALLDLGEFAQAAQAVQDVPDGYQYQVTYDSRSQNFTRRPSSSSWLAIIPDREGGNGLDYISSNDPRTDVITLSGKNMFGRPYTYPGQYSGSGTDPLTLASGIEARLIEAEAALQRNDIPTWLDKLNHLRETAISPALPDTTDPGTDEGRVDLTFRERAFWLFLTGHRLGDMRRLVREYNRDEQQVFPVGAYAGGTGQYGPDVAMPLPPEEQTLNPLYKGCIGRGA
jgi:hypothetical protein